MKEFIEKLIGRLEDNGQKMCEAKSSVPFGKHSSANHRYYKAISVKKAIFIINQLAEEYINCSTDTSTDCSTDNGWIPCSERLPEIGQKVLVTYADRYVGGHYGVCDGMYIYSLKMWDIADYEDTDDFKVLAWRELPQPYQPKGE